MNALVEATESEGFWMLQASIFPENVASRDTVIMERRSRVTGLD